MRGREKNRYLYQILGCSSSTGTRREKGIERRDEERGSESEREETLIIPLLLLRIRSAFCYWKREGVREE